MTDLTEDYWDSRYKVGETGWDLGGVSPPLKSYFDQLTDKNLHILVPGAGNAYEAEYLFKQGFKNVHIVDFSPRACQQFQTRIPSFPKENILCKDFFEVKGSFDLIIEQTFFCALDPKLREQYRDKIFQLLKPGGKLVGLLFDDELNQDGPPFGGCKEDYIDLFQQKFQIKTMERCTNSIKLRSGRELFIKLLKPHN